MKKVSRMTKSRNKKIADGWERFEDWIRPNWKPELKERIKQLKSKFEKLGK